MAVIFVNRIEQDILLSLSHEPFQSQRILSEISGYSLGAINRSLKTLHADGYLLDNRLSDKALLTLQQHSPQNAIILAAGPGMRMVPINMTCPKGLLEVRGEPLIERIIRQLHEVGVHDITLVVGFMKESFDYLVDLYDVDLVVNPEYLKKNNLFSLSLVADKISNTYIIPSDLWCVENPFRKEELYSWYMVSTDLKTSDVRINRKMELIRLPEKQAGNAMVGIAYILEQDSLPICERIRRFSRDSRHDSDYWETALYCDSKMLLPARAINPTDIQEINTYEDLRELDQDSNHIKSEAVDEICSVFRVSAEQLSDFSLLKKGMTNRSFMFTVRDQRYIMRIPGEGTNLLINREQEAEVYRTISGKGLCDDPIAINPHNGFKITRYLDGIRVADPSDSSDVKRCIEKLRNFHQMNLQVSHEFDLFGQIELYEQLRGGLPSVYRDYLQTKDHVFSLRKYIEQHQTAWCLTHIDAVPDNFLFYTDTDGKEALQLTDWEYAGMQDPHLDLAMWSIYSFYSRPQVDHLIDLYFHGTCSHETRIKIYCYVSAAGLLWSNWCEYKATLGVEFGEYAMKQYRFAKDFYRFAVQEMDP